MESLKYLAVIIFLLFQYPLSIMGQSREPQNIYRVTVNSRYVLEDGQRTTKFFAIGQQIYDSLGRMHTEIDFTWETRRPDNYRWHYFDGLTKWKTEFYENEQLARIEKYSYTEDTLINELEVYEVNPNDTILAVRVVYSYDSNGNINRATGYNNAGKRGFRARYKYDEFGNEIRRRVRGKRAVPPDSIIYLKRTLKYDTLNRVVMEQLDLEKVSSPRETKKIEFTYDDVGNIAEKIIRDASGNQIMRKEYTYRKKDNRIQLLKVYDANNTLVDYLAWRYEIYKTNNRRQRILE